MRKALFTVCGLFVASSELFGMVDMNSLQNDIFHVSSEISVEPQKFCSNQEKSENIFKKLIGYYKDPKRILSEGIKAWEKLKKSKPRGDFMSWVKIMELQKALEAQDKQTEPLRKYLDARIKEESARRRSAIEELEKKERKKRQENNSKGKRMPSMLGYNDTFTVNCMCTPEAKPNHDQFLDQDQLFSIKHKRGITTINAWFRDNFLNLKYPVEVKVANEKKSYVFDGVKLDSCKQLLLSANDIGQICGAISCDGFVCLKLKGENKGENKGFIVSQKSFYIGDIENDQATGKGILIEENGKISCGSFDYGVFMNTTDDMKKWFQKVFIFSK